MIKKTAHKGVIEYIAESEKPDVVGIIAGVGEKHKAHLHDSDGIVIKDGRHVF